MRPLSLSIIVSSMAALLTGCQATTSSHQATRYSPEDIDWSDCVTTIPRDQENPGRTGLIEAGEQAPNFELESIDGDVVSLQDYRGQVVVLDFWASWCRPCANEMSIMNDFADQARENNLPVKVLSINTRNWMYPDQGIPRILHFLERHEIDLPRSLRRPRRIGQEGLWRDGHSDRDHH